MEKNEVKKGYMDTAAIYKICFVNNFKDKSEDDGGLILAISLEMNQSEINNKRLMFVIIFYTCCVLFTTFLLIKTC